MIPINLIFLPCVSIIIEDKQTWIFFWKKITCTFYEWPKGTHLFNAHSFFNFIQLQIKKCKISQDFQGGIWIFSLRQDNLLKMTGGR